MRLIFMGTPDFSVPVLEALVEAGHEIAAVYCQPARPAGRGKKDRPSAVETRAVELGLPVRHPVNFKDVADVSDFAALNADAAIVVAYGLILPQSLLDAPRFGCLNIHASLLPRWRGAAPIHRAIMAGDAETGVAIMQMEAGLDTGPVLLSTSTTIAPDDTTLTLHNRLSAMGATLIIDALEGLQDLVPIAQSGIGVTYAAKIEKPEARIDWGQDAKVIDRKIRGLSPFPGAWCEINATRVKLLESQLAKGDGLPGTLLASDSLTVACGSDAVQILRLQRAGKAAVSAQAFLRGAGLSSGDKLA